ncbi:basic proline-rich protein-like [Elephas maximus indicus]|uniref:basic proline-rich protein-like n=1 Tax=Elephas maximus indicus TaxID=99487 RepID=UPI002116596D|nr:basic proline-rich protein-like [Elephas maximus indicus]
MPGTFLLALVSSRCYGPLLLPTTASRGPGLDARPLPAGSGHIPSSLDPWHHPPLPQGTETRHSTPSCLLHTFPEATWHQGPNPDPKPLPPALDPLLLQPQSPGHPVRSSGPFLLALNPTRHLPRPGGNPAGTPGPFALRNPGDTAQTTAPSLRLWATPITAQGPRGTLPRPQDASCQLWTSPAAPQGPKETHPGPQAPSAGFRPIQPPAMAPRGNGPDHSPLPAGFGPILLLAATTRVPHQDPRPPPTSSEPVPQAPDPSRCPPWQSGDPVLNSGPFLLPPNHFCHCREPRGNPAQMPRSLFAGSGLLTLPLDPSYHPPQHPRDPARTPGSFPLAPDTSRHRSLHPGDPDRTTAPFPPALDPSHLLRTPPNAPHSPQGTSRDPRPLPPGSSPSHQPPAASAPRLPSPDPGSFCQLQTSPVTHYNTKETGVGQQDFSLWLQTTTSAIPVPKRTQPGPQASSPSLQIPGATLQPPRDQVQTKAPSLVSGTSCHLLWLPGYPAWISGPFPESPDPSRGHPCTLGDLAQTPSSVLPAPDPSHHPPKHPRELAGCRRRGGLSLDPWLIPAGSEPLPPSIQGARPETQAPIIRLRTPTGNARGTLGTWPGRKPFLLILDPSCCQPRPPEEQNLTPGSFLLAPDLFRLRLWPLGYLAGTQASSAAPDPSSHPPLHPREPGDPRSLPVHSRPLSSQPGAHRNPAKILDPFCRLWTPPNTRRDTQGTRLGRQAPSLLLWVPSACCRTLPPLTVDPREPGPNSPRISTGSASLLPTVVTRGSSPDPRSLPPGSRPLLPLPVDPRVSSRWLQTPQAAAHGPKGTWPGTQAQSHRHWAPPATHRATQGAQPLLAGSGPLPLQPGAAKGHISDPRPLPLAPDPSSHVSRHPGDMDQTTVPFLPSPDNFRHHSRHKETWPGLQDPCDGSGPLQPCAAAPRGQGPDHGPLPCGSGQLQPLPKALRDPSRTLDPPRTPDPFCRLPLPPEGHAWTQGPFPPAPVSPATHFGNKGTRPRSQAPSCCPPQPPESPTEATRPGPRRLLPAPDLSSYPLRHQGDPTRTSGPLLLAPDPFCHRNDTDPRLSLASSRPIPRPTAAPKGHSPEPRPPLTGSEPFPTTASTPRGPCPDPRPLRASSGPLLPSPQPSRFLPQSSRDQAWNAGPFSLPMILPAIQRSPQNAWPVLLAPLGRLRFPTAAHHSTQTTVTLKDLAPTLDPFLPAPDPSHHFCATHPSPKGTTPGPQAPSHWLWALLSPRWHPGYLAQCPDAFQLDPDSSCHPLQHLWTQPTSSSCPQPKRDTARTPDPFLLALDTSHCCRGP